VTVLTAGFESLHGAAVESGVSVLRVRSRRTSADRSSFLEKASFVAHAAFAVPHLLRTSKPQGCIVFFSLPCGPLGRLVRALSGVPYVVALRGGDVPGSEPELDSLHRWLSPLRRWVLRGASAVVANSNGLKALSERADPITVGVVPNGVDTSAFSNVRSGRHPPYRFLFVGRLNPQKNVPLLLSAAGVLRRSSSASFRVAILGDGPLAAELHAQARSLGVDGIVDWEPWVERGKMPERYATADCLVNPSLNEGMPNAVLEAMACGLPVIASEAAGHTDLVEHEVTGLLFRSGDVSALASAMQRLLEQPALNEAWGRAGRIRVENRYAWSTAAASYVRLLG
jgi:glycosyltransferase involved in cell wall biosynthesis